MADTDSASSSSLDPDPQSSSSKPKPQSSYSESQSSSSESTQPSSPSTSDSHIISIAQQRRFMDSLPANIATEHQYQLIDFFALYIHRYINTAKFELYVLKLIKKNQIAVNAFKKLLPTANLIPFTCKNGNTIFNREHCHFNDKVRAGLYDDTNNYMDWLEHLIEYNSGNETFPEFKRNVEPHFVNMADLLKEFEEKFGECNEDVNVEESKGDSNSDDSSDQEPASKLRKTK